MQIDRLIEDPDCIKVVVRDVDGPLLHKLGSAIAFRSTRQLGISILPFVRAGANPAAVYRSVNNPYVDRYLRDQRRDLYPGGLFGRGKVEGDHGTIRKPRAILTDFVRRGGRLGLVCDLYDRNGIPVPFFARTRARKRSAP